MHRHSFFSQPNNKCFNDRTKIVGFLELQKRKEARWRAVSESRQKERESALYISIQHINRHTNSPTTNVYSLYFRYPTRLEHFTSLPELFHWHSALLTFQITRRANRIFVQVSIMLLLCYWEFSLLPLHCSHFTT